MFRRASFACCPKDGSVLFTTAEDPLIGAVLGERYLIEECIGEGGMGRVYRAVHPRIGRAFAVKVLFGDLAANQTVVSRFAREAEAAGRLQHHNLVSVVDFGEAEGGLLYLAMDFVEGRGLRDIIARDHPLGRQRIIRLMLQLCHGLAHAHGRGLVHRDFKTDNILVAEDGHGEVAKIVDFGIAMLRDQSDPSERLTTEGVALGTPAYMAPEQAAGEPMDERTDLFSLGVVLYEMLAGALPFEGSPMSVIRCNIAVEPPPIAERRPGVTADAELEALANWLMAKNIDDRPADAGAVIRHLEVLEARARRLGSAPAIVVPPASEGATLGLAATLEFEPVARNAPTAPRPELAAPRPEVAAVEPVRSRARVAVVVVALLALGLAGVVAGWLLAAGRGSNEAAMVQPAAGGSRMDASLAAAGLVAGERDVSAPRAGAGADHDAAAAPPEVSGDAADGGTSESRPAAGATSSSSRRRGGKRTGKDRDGRRKQPDKDGGDTDKAGERSPISSEALNARYIEVGQALEKLLEARGEEVTGALRKRYFAIPFMDAMRDAAVRNQVDDELRRLHRDIRKQLP